MTSTISGILYRCHFKGQHQQLTIEVVFCWFKFLLVSGTLMRTYIQQSKFLTSPFFNSLYDKPIETNITNNTSFSHRMKIQQYIIQYLPLSEMHCLLSYSELRQLKDNLRLILDLHKFTIQFVLTHIYFHKNKEHKCFISYDTFLVR